MGIDFINKVIVASIVLGLAGLIIGGSYFGFMVGLGIFVGTAWGCINLYLIKCVMHSALEPAAKSYFNVIVLLGIKFPILYAAGFGILKMGYFSVISLLFGFSLPFIVIFTKGVALWLFEKKEPNPT